MPKLSWLPLFRRNKKELTPEQERGQELIALLRDGAENCDVERVLELIRTGAPVDERDKGWGRTALMWAVRYGHKEVVTALLGKNANINISDYDGCTALLMALSYSRDDLAALVREEGLRIARETKSRDAERQQAKLEEDIRKAIVLQNPLSAKTPLKLRRS